MYLQLNKILLLILPLVLSLHAEDAPATVEQLQTKITEQQKEIEQLRAVLAATEQWDARNMAVMQAAVNACIGPRPQIPSVIKK